MEKAARHRLHLLAAPLYLAAAVLILALLSGHPPAGALQLALLAGAAALPPLALCAIALRRHSGRLLRLALLLALGEVLLLGWTSSPGRLADYGVARLDETRVRQRLAHASGPGYQRLLSDVKALAAFGSRLTGSEGLEKTLLFVKNRLGELGWTAETDGREAQLPEPPPEKTIRRTDFPVLVPEDLGSAVWLGEAGSAAPFAAYALRPNGVQPCATPAQGLEGPLAYLGRGRPEEQAGKDLRGRIAVYEFASGEAWLGACEAGALAALFLAGETVEEGPPGQPGQGAPAPAGEPGGGEEADAEPAAGETTRQADAKWSALLPLNFPRVYLDDPAACVRVRAQAREGGRGGVRSGMSWRTVQAPVLEALIRGSSERELLIAAHADASAIAPARSFGGQELFGLGAWLMLFEHFSLHPPAFSLRFVLFTGHGQDQAPERGYYHALRQAVGDRVAMAIGVDLNPESDGLVLTDETLAEVVNPAHFWWLKRLLFTVDSREPAWLDQLESLSGRPRLDRGGRLSKYAFYGGRPSSPKNEWRLWLAPLDRWPAASHAPSFPTANQGFAQLKGLSIAFQTCDAYRQRHFTCQDRIEPWLGKAGNLKPQLELLLALLGALADLDPARFPVHRAEPYRLQAGYNEVRIQASRWNPEILWYDRKTAPGTRTFALLVPTDSNAMRGRRYAYWPRPLAPNRYLHRNLQFLMTRYLAEVSPTGQASFQNVFSPHALTSYDALLFTLDGQGRLTHAFDQGFHGDGEFRFLDRALPADRLHLQVPLFECGALVLFNLTDTDRFSYDKGVEYEQHRTFGASGNQDPGEDPQVRIREVRLAETHTDPDAFSWVQYRQTAMVFLKPGLPCEILAESDSKKIMLFNDDRSRRNSPATAPGPPGGQAAGAVPAEDPAGEGAGVFAGFQVGVGEELRLAGTLPLAAGQLARLTRQRLQRYQALNVRSTSANLFQERADANEKSASADRQAGRAAEAEAGEARFWSNQATAYRFAFALLLDVVSTTIFYFVLLLPFGYLVERLVFPQPTLWRTCLVSAAVFSLFTLLLCRFHPGFQLAGNIFVTIVTFLIVIFTLPALVIILSRGLTLALEPGARFQRRQSGGRETAGVLLAALALAVSNMRRRSLRTALTLATITILVTSLVLLTSTAADTRIRREPQLAPQAAYRGIQVLNLLYHQNGMSERTGELIRRSHQREALIVGRRYFNPGWGCTLSCWALPEHPSQETAPRLIELQGGIALDPAETQVSGLAQAIRTGRFFLPGDRRVCLLSEDLARRHGLRVGMRLGVHGLELEIIGLLDPAQVDSERVDLSGKPVTPLAFYRPFISAESPDHLLAKETLFVPSALLEEDRPVVYPLYSLVLLPRPASEAELARKAQELQEWLRRAQEAGLGPLEDRLAQASGESLSPEECARLIELGPQAGPALRQLAAFHLERSALRSIAGKIAADHARIDVLVSEPAPPWLPEAEERVDLLTASARISLQSGSFLILPFLISFLMLLSIMIGSVYERKREIQVFSSVGLAPRHAAGMFLAEALVYAGIASVLGYFLGIILLDGFSRAGWLPADFYPNYFGKVVIWSAVLATSASVLSVLYPMWIASRLVNPSLERIWRIETEPQGGHWLIHLPFVASDRSEVLGILGYLREFLGFQQGERSGAFVMEDDPRLGRDAQTGNLSLSGRLWLAPFERNLVQAVRLWVRPEEGKARFRLDLEILRHSGPEELWRRSNHTFVGAMRRQLLLWRALPDETMREYAGLAERALEEANDGAARAG